MHELSIAVDLLEAASARVRQEGGGRILAVYLRIGPLSGVVVDALRSAFEIAAHGTLAEGASLDVEEVPVVLFCASCEAEKPADDIYAFCCPDCGCPTGDIRTGRELEVTALEIDET